MEDKAPLKAGFLVDTGAPPPMITIRPTYGAKRLMDLTLVLLTIPITVPLIAVLWVFVRQDGATGFFGHSRIGRDGQMFNCWKLRSMVEGAEAKLHIHLAENPKAAAEWASHRKLTHDPRITRLGQLLRKTRLDELPQLWNVLIGEMSLVGPRPITRSELGKYGVYRNVYLAQRPGLTGVWQVLGDTSDPYSDRVAMDVTYAARRGVFYDIGLMLCTVGVMLVRVGK